MNLVRVLSIPNKSESSSTNVLTWRVHSSVTLCLSILVQISPFLTGRGRQFDTHTVVVYKTWTNVDKSDRAGRQIRNTRSKEMSRSPDLLMVYDSVNRVGPEQ